MKPSAHSPPPVQHLRWVGMFTAAYVSLAAIGALAAGNREFVIYIGVMIVMAAVILGVHRKYPLLPGLLWCLSVWGMLHMAGGLLRIPDSWPKLGSGVLYNWWIIPDRLKYDQLVHAYGFGITTWLAWHVLRQSLRSADGTPVRPTSGILSLCAAAGMGFGALNEVIEFTATRLLPNTNVGDYENTGWDLVSNLTGCVIASICIRRWCAKAPPVNAGRKPKRRRP